MDVKGFLLTSNNSALKLPQLSAEVNPEKWSAHPNHALEFSEPEA
jgi:hypothetical protein